nr:MAG TPA: hypothetical protein [Caudoviricetes sp.]
MVDTNCINHVAFPFFIERIKGYLYKNNHILK